MAQQISDAELEIMKIVWANPEEVTLFPYIMEGLAARGKPCQKNTSAPGKSDAATNIPRLSPRRSTRRRRRRTSWIKSMRGAPKAWSPT